MVGKIFIGLFCALVIAALVFIFADRISDYPPKKKVKSILCAVGGLGAFAAIIYFIRVNPMLTALRESHDLSFILLVPFALFAIMMLIGGSLRGEESHEPRNKRERIGEKIFTAGTTIVLIELAAFPVLLAFIIK